MPDERDGPVFVPPTTAPVQTQLVRREVQAIVTQANQQLATLDSSPFSQPAFDALQKHVSSYISDLVSQSAFEAKRGGLDTISESHVDHASEYLVGNSGKNPFRHVGTIGGVLLGASVSNLLSVASSGAAFTFTSVALTTVLGVVGAFAIALHIAKD